MKSEELLNQLRESVEKQIAAGQVSSDTVYIFLQLQIMDKLDLANNNLIDVESAVNDLNPRKGEY